MTVNELIAKLRELDVDPETTEVRIGYEGIDAPISTVGVESTNFYGDPAPPFVLLNEDA